MQPMSAVAIFCEDIREEASGQNSIVGTLPDNLTLAAAQPPQENARPLFPKLGLYLRINFDANGEPPRDLSVRLINTDGEPHPLQGWSRETVDKAFADSRENGMPVVGLILTVVAAPFIFPGAGKLMAVVNVDGADHIAGAMNVIVSQDSSLSSQSAGGDR
jgi:hypothetical protein